MMWWVKDPDRLKREVADIDALREQEPWLSAATPRLLKGLKFAFDFDVTVNGETFPFTLEYPAFFPETPPLVIPRDGRRLSDHQYGAGGELCLEFRSDNWDPSVSGTMVIASTHRLLAGERAADEGRAIVPSGTSRLARAAAARLALPVFPHPRLSRLRQSIAGRRILRRYRHRNRRAKENVDRLRRGPRPCRCARLARDLHS
jgi:ubiquitin-protein ligase